MARGPADAAALEAPAAGAASLLAARLLPVLLLWDGHRGTPPAPLGACHRATKGAAVPSFWPCPKGRGLARGAIGACAAMRAMTPGQRRLASLWLAMEGGTGSGEGFCPGLMGLLPESLRISCAAAAAAVPPPVPAPFPASASTRPQASVSALGEEARREGLGASRELCSRAAMSVTAPTGVGPGIGQPRG